MDKPNHGVFCTGEETRFRFFYDRPDWTFGDHADWTAFDQGLLSSAPDGKNFVMHHQCDPETTKIIAQNMRTDMALPDGSKKDLFHKPAYYIVEMDTSLAHVTAGRFDFGVWWDVAVCEDRDAVLAAMRAGENPQGVLHDGSIKGILLFLLFRNFHADEVSMRVFHKESSQRIFHFASEQAVPMIEVDEIDFYEGTL